MAPERKNTPKGSGILAKMGKTTKKGKKNKKEAQEEEEEEYVPFRLPEKYRAYVEQNNIPEMLKEAVEAAFAIQGVPARVMSRVLLGVGPPVLNSDPCVQTKPPANAGLLDNCVIFLPQVAVETFRLQPNFNDDHGPNTLWAGRYWQLRAIMRKQLELERKKREGDNFKTAKSPAQMQADFEKKGQWQKFLYLQRKMKTWVLLSQSSFSLLDRLEGKNLRGVMVFMHGSGGIVWHNIRFLRMVAGLNYIAIAPDEMAGNHFRRRTTRAIHTRHEDTSYWQNTLFYEGKAGVDGENLEFSTKVEDVLASKEYYRTLYEKVYHVRRAELHYILSRLGLLAERLGVVIMGCSEGAMTVTRFDDQRYGRMIVGRIIVSYACEYCYMHTSETDAKFGGQLDVPTLNMIGTHDEFFGPPAHGDFVGSCASKISAQPDGWGKANVTGNAYESMLQQGMLSGLVATFPTGEHDLTLTHNMPLRDVMLDFLHRPARCFDMLHNWRSDKYLSLHTGHMRECGPNGLPKVTDEPTVPGQRLLWMHCAQSKHSAVNWKNEDPHTVAMAKRREFAKKFSLTEADIELEETYLRTVKVKPTMAAKKPKKLFSMQSMGAMLAGADSDDVATMMQDEDIYAGVRHMSVVQDASRIPPCTICASQDHGWRDCKHKCETCSMLCCPGSNPRIGSSCAVYSGKIAGAENALGQPLPKYLIDAMFAKREKMIKDGEIKDLEC